MAQKYFSPSPAYLGMHSLMLALTSGLFLFYLVFVDIHSFGTEHFIDVNKIHRVPMSGKNSALYLMAIYFTSATFVFLLFLTLFLLKSPILRLIMKKIKE